MVTTVNVHEAKSSLSRLLQQVEAGERVVIARAGRPVADLVPHTQVDIVFGLARGALSYGDDFDQEDEVVVAAFEGA